MSGLIQGVCQRIQHRQRFPALSFGFRPPAMSCWVWTKELDLADAAAAELQIVPPYLHLTVTLHGVDLAFQRLHVGNRREIEILAPNVGLEAIEELSAQHKVARRGPRLDHRGALPVLPWFS